MGFDPATLLLVASTVVSAGGAIAGGIAQANAANYQAHVADINKQIALENANRAILRSQEEARQQDEQTRALLGAQEAEQSASGLKLGGRSFALTRKAAAELGRQDTLNVRQAGELESYKFKTDVVNAQASSDLYHMQASNALLQGFLDAGSSIIGGARSSGLFTTRTAKASYPYPYPTSLRT